VAAAEEYEPETLAAEPHRDVAPIAEVQLEQAARPVAVHRERSSIEAPHDPPTDAEIHHDADPHA